MKLRDATSHILKTIDSGALTYFKRFTKAHKSFIEFCMIIEDQAIQINLRPTNDFRTLNTVAIHLLVDDPEEFEYALSDALQIAERDLFDTIEVYCLDTSYINRTTSSKDLLEVA